MTLEAKVRKGEVVAEALFRKPQAPGLVAAAFAVGTSALLPGKPLPALAHFPSECPQPWHLSWGRGCFQLSQITKGRSIDLYPSETHTMASGWHTELLPCSFSVEITLGIFSGEEGWAQLWAGRWV